MAKTKDRPRRRYKPMTFARLQSLWMKTSIGQERGELEADRPDDMELALNLMSFEIGARLRIIRLLTRRDATSDEKSRMSNHCKELEKQTDFLHKAGLYLIDSNRR